jgi:hypothetical protein
MDSFTTIKPTQVPTNAEGNGIAGSAGYSVVFEVPADKEQGGNSGSFNIPVDFETKSNQGSGTYCIIA